MADVKSREVMITYKCMKCYAEMSVSERRRMRMDGRSCFLCRGPIREVEHKVSDTRIKVNVDVSDVLTGLKAVQREARKATAELKKLEAQQVQMVDLPFHPEVSK